MHSNNMGRTLTLESNCYHGAKPGQTEEPDGGYDRA
jgi:hypothetical protein